MPDPLITVEQLEARLARTFAEGAAADQAAGLIDDASALVRDAGGSDFEAPVPAVVVATVAQVVRRALDNPGELTAEQIGAYGWQAQHSGSTSGAAIYLTRKEERLVRRAAGRASFSSVDLSSDPDAEDVTGIDGIEADE